MNRRFAIKSIVATLAGLVGLGKKEPEVFVVETDGKEMANTPTTYLGATCLGYFAKDNTVKFPTPPDEGRWKLARIVFSKVGE